ncbi:MAG: 6-phosphofructokinase [Bacteriovoracaceae bacterium]|nr:6-phosphofructokinase [Bacteriovoracaceae bacterium]
MTQKKKDASAKKETVQSQVKKDVVLNPNNIKSVAIMCSGGDAPGMNVVIRSAVRTALGMGLKPYGINRGWSGLLEGDVVPLDASSVGNIMQKGGTILQTSRCPEFHEPEIRKEAANILRRKGIDALIVCGGNGSFNGAWKLHSEHDIPIIGIPGTIDNDISGTDYSIGFDTAVQTAVEAVDKIRDTAHSHARTFIVEVMGRKSPAIALHVGVSCGAENIVFPNDHIDFEAIHADIARGMDRGKQSSIIIVAEGETPGLCYDIKRKLADDYDISSHLCILGHIQRGGKPTALDRFRACRMGYRAIKALMDGERASVTAYLEGDVKLVPFSNCLENKKEYEKPFLELVKLLAI